MPGAKRKTKARKGIEAARERHAPGREPTILERIERAAYLRACRKAARTYALTVSNIPVAWQGQAPGQALTRKPSGKVYETGHSIRGDKAGHVARLYSRFALEVSQARPVAACEFESIIYLKGIKAATFKHMIGCREPVDYAREPQDTWHGRKLYDGVQLDRKLGKIKAASPCPGSQDYDARFEDKMILAGRKGKRQVQRPGKGSSIILPSQEQLKRAGIEFDCRIAGEYSETIPGHKRERQRALIANDNTLISGQARASIIESMPSDMAGLYCATGALQAAITRASLVPRGKPGKPLQVPSGLTDSLFLNALLYRRLKRNARFAPGLFGPGF